MSVGEAKGGDVSDGVVFEKVLRKYVICKIEMVLSHAV